MFYFSFYFIGLAGTRHFLYRYSRQRPHHGFKSPYTIRPCWYSTGSHDSFTGRQIQWMAAILQIEYFTGCYPSRPRYMHFSGLHLRVRAAWIFQFYITVTSHEPHGALDEWHQEYTRICRKWIAVWMCQGTIHWCGWRSGHTDDVSYDLLR